MAGLRRILIVEDNAQLREIYGHFLQTKGYDVQLAVDGEDGLTKAQEFRPELVFLDIMMPKKDGFEVLKMLRHLPQYNCTKAKLVLLTNLGDNSKVSEAVREDMDGYVVKAEIELSDLLRIIESFKP